MAAGTDGVLDFLFLPGRRRVPGDIPTKIERARESDVGSLLPSFDLQRSVRKLPVGCEHDRNIGNAPKPPQNQSFHGGSPKKTVKVQDVWSGFADEAHDVASRELGSVEHARLSYSIPRISLD